MTDERSEVYDYTYLTCKRTDCSYTQSSMIHDDSSAPATKADMQMVLHTIQKVQTTQLVMQQDMQDQFVFVAEQMGNLATKDELHTLKEELQEEIKTSIQTSEQHILAAVEHRRYDDVGITNDRFIGHDKRIHALEVQTRLVA